MLGTARTATEVLLELDERRRGDPDVHAAHLFGLVYPSGDHELESLVRSVYERFLFSNSLNPLRFPGLSSLERDVISMCAGLVHRESSSTPPGCVTAGGTESILMSMLVSRERARTRGIARAQILAPESAHPAYAKAAHYLGMDLVAVPLDDGYRCDVAAARALASTNTAVVVASAFSYPYGVMDPVTELAALARERGADCHVDACIGGFVLPFMEALGVSVPSWDFRVEGVTQISMDVHKYGFVPKGVSVLLHRSEDWRRLQGFRYDAWGAGRYATLSVAGARSGAPLAAAWAVMTHLGQPGYERLTADLCRTTDAVRAGIENIEGLAIVGQPIGPVLACTSDLVDLYTVGDRMEERGWFLNRNTKPKGLHMMLSPAHEEVVSTLLADLADSVARPGENATTSPRYN